MNRQEYLYTKCVRGLASPEEQSELVSWLADPKNESESRELISRAFEEEKPLTDMTPETASAILKAILEADQEKPVVFNPKPVAFVRKWWAAAAAVLALSFASYLIFAPKPEKRIAAAKIQVMKDDVAPGSNKAILTLGNGSKILLSGARNGTLARQGNTKIIKTDSGRLSYTALHERPSEVVYNTLSTPRGGQYQLTLSDGSRVWLNAASSITFPAAFTGNERKVTITGEVYFEVAHNASKPFIVRAAEEELQILGTDFNVNAYGDESSVLTTLLEGSLKVMVAGSQQSAILKPGQQTQIKNTQLSVINDVNTDEVVAWKDGLFNFENADLQTVMRQFARWYDVEVKFEGAVPQGRFFGIMSRSSSLASVLKALRANGIKFRIENKNLIVQQ
ncbi:MAG: FecR domain-containing protein [Bacteroidota bacterium]|nr:FecR domain-containing protein [Bacteroidota bacterium]